MSISNLTSGDAKVKAPLWAKNDNNNDTSYMIDSGQAKVKVPLWASNDKNNKNDNNNVSSNNDNDNRYMSQQMLSMAQVLPCQVSKWQWWKVLDDLSQQTAKRCK